MGSGLGRYYKARRRREGLLIPHILAMSEQKRDRVSSPVSEKEAGVAFIDVAGQEEAEADDVIRAETEFT